MSVHSFVRYYRLLGISAVIVVALIFFVHVFSTRAMGVPAQVAVTSATVATTSSVTVPPTVPAFPPLDTADYDARMAALASGDASGTWPTEAPYPDPGAILPFKRIVAFYGNLYSKSMGILGQYPPDVVLQKLAAVVAQWQAADPNTPVQPALQYIAVVAQGAPGPDKYYISRMPFSEIDKVMAMAAQANAIVILDVQPGDSTVEREVPLLETYLKMPNVELGLDPEFAMKNGKKPGTSIGSLDASDINFASAYLANLVDEYNLPPKVLIVHRFTGPMVTNYQDIKTMPEVQIVMDMDGWGDVAHKTAAYREVIEDDPVQFTGFKLFFKNDTTRSKSVLMTPQQVLSLTPKPIYIQYQ